MRSRTIREGSVGLLILLGIGLFGGLLLWLRGFNPTNRPYQLVAEFKDTMGVQVGTPVLYRGVSVGRVISITPRSNAVDLGLEITQSDLRMPNRVTVETVESGLIGEMSIEITPLVELPARAAEIPPVGKDCEGDVILCDGDRLVGVTGPSYEALLRSAGEVAELFADPELVAQLKTVLESVTQTTNDAGVLAQEATELTRLARAEIGPLADSARGATDSAAIAAQQFALTASDINSLIGENRGMLVDTLANVQSASLQLRGAADVLGPRLQSGELVDDLERLVGNAADASADLQAITASLNNPANLVLLQQTLESARDALASAQKVMADVDEITGDPAIRQQLRNLINGLGNLVSSTQSLEQQTEVASMLAPLNEQAQQQAQQPARRDRLDQLANEQIQAEQPVSPATAPLLIFDGERYILRPTDQLAGSPDEAADKNVR
ncbi:MAG: MCE family protein [Phormidesmis sp. RL_2_1]|nr:MCE family protein [Phormidesmis sp. RL_2_1]